MIAPSSAVQRLLRDWELEQTGTLPQGWMSEVVAVRTKDGTDAVLKLVTSDQGGSTSIAAKEIAALEVLHGPKSVRLLRSDADRSALLLARVQPATSLSHQVTDDVHATEIVASLISDVQAPAQEAGRVPGITTAHHLAADFHAIDLSKEEAPPFSVPLLERCRATLDDLVATEGPTVVGHGDLHHGNILYAGDDHWVAIDPDPFVVEVAVLAVPFLRNPFSLFEGDDDPRPVLQRRSERLAHLLSIDEARLRAWAFAVTGLCFARRWDQRGELITAWLRCTEALAD